MERQRRSPKASHLGGASGSANRQYEWAGARIIGRTQISDRRGRGRGRRVADLFLFEFGNEESRSQYHEYVRERARSGRDLAAQPIHAWERRAAARFFHPR